MPIDVSAVKKLTDAVEAIRKVAESAAGDTEATEEAGRGAVPGESPATAMTNKARESYRKTARWMLAAFASVGVVIFGSLPFAAIADVELTWPGSLWLIGGLVLAVAGIVAAVIAVSLVSEPEDASLGELDQDLRAVQQVKDNEFVFDKNNRPVFTINKLKAWWNPRLRSCMELAEILHGPESAAHLGPRLTDDKRRPTVTHLIKKLGVFESKHADLAPKVAKLAVAVETQEKRTKELAKLLAELRRRLSELPDATPEADKATLNRRIEAASNAYTSTTVALSSARRNLVREQAALAAVDDELELYHDHRNLVLAESGVMQLRGTFRLARRILAVAAVLTLFGGTAYALSLPGGNDDEDATSAESTTEAPPVYATSLPATVLVHPGTTPAAELERDCVGRELDAIWVGDGPIPATVGPFTVLVTDPACAGQLTVRKGEGRFALSR